MLTRWSARRSQGVGEPVRLVAEQPGRRPVEQVAGLVEQHLAGTVGGQHGQPGLLGGADGAGRVGLGRDRQVEHAADAGPDGLGVVEVDRLPRQHDRVDAQRVGGPDQGAGVAGVADVGTEGDQGAVARPGDATARASASGTSTNEQTATTPAGVTLSLSEARARSSTSVTRGAAATSASYRSEAATVANTSTTHPADSAPSTAFGPSARNSRRSARTERRLSLRVSLTRVFPAVRGVIRGLDRLDDGSPGLDGADSTDGLRRPWAR